MVVVDGQRRVVQVARERCPAVEVVVDGLGRGRAVRDLAALREEPVVQRSGDGRRACSSLVQPLLRGEQLDLALDPVQLADEVDGRRSDGALVGLVQLDELAPRMGARRGHDWLENGGQRLLRRSPPDPMNSMFWDALMSACSGPR